MNKQIILLLLVISSAPLVACDYIASHTTDIQQGNIIETKEVAQLKIGMKKASVAKIMGSPVLDSTFDDQRWFYVYTSQVSRKPLVHKRLVIWFRNGRVSKIQRDT